MGHADLKDQYVILTGAKNNAGDYLIKSRAKGLFAAFRPDRQVIDYNGWEQLTSSQLDEINASRALILTGGPALQTEMYPKIYPLVKDLDQINVPVLTMSLGWKSSEGSWEATYGYPLSKKTIDLLEKIENSCYHSSVRDYHTLSVLHANGFNHFLMTGCSAFYSPEGLAPEPENSAEPKHISFSLGTCFFRNKRLEIVNKQLILHLRNSFPDAEYTVVFHHSTKSALYRLTHNPNLDLLEAQIKLIPWLERHRIGWVDISGDDNSMEVHYRNCDLHIGFRIHAHILMASFLKPSVLIAEDGRGTALRDVLGGLVLNGCFRPLPGIIGKISRKFGCLGESLMTSNALPDSIVKELQYEIKNRYPRIICRKESLLKHFNIMRAFLEQLP